MLCVMRTQRLMGLSLVHIKCTTQGKRGREVHKGREGEEEERRKSRKQTQNCFTSSHFCQVPFPHYVLRIFESL